LTRAPAAPGRAIAVLIGAAVGLFLAWLLEITGHPAWSILLLLLCAFAPALIKVLLTVTAGRRFQVNFGRAIMLRRQPGWIKLVAVGLIAVVPMAVEYRFGINPRNVDYLLLLPPVIVCATLFGFVWGLVSVVLSLIVADCIFALPAFSFMITEWKDALGLAAFAVLGALAALAIDDFLSLPE
jgi:hypothetical protein